MCEDKYLEWISRYIDGDLNEDETKELEAHFKTCSDCYHLYGEMLKTANALSALPKEDVDDAWIHQTVNKMKQDKKERFKRLKNFSFKNINYKRVVAYAASVIVIVGMTVVIKDIADGNFGFSGMSRDNNMNYGESYYPTSQDHGDTITDKGQDEMSYGDGEISPYEASGMSGGTDKEGSTGDAKGGIANFDPEKIIYSGNITMYTDNYEETSDQILAYTNGIGGFVQYASYQANEDSYYDYTAYGYLQIRVPVDQFDAALASIENFGEVSSSSLSSVNVSQEYHNYQSELESYKIQEERLLSYLSEADDISDLLTIESELSRVRTQIDYLTTILQSYDNQIDYSTIYITMYEQEVSTISVSSPFGTIWQDIKKGFIASINFLLRAISFIIVWIVKLIPFGLIAALIIYIIKKVRKTPKAIVRQEEKKDE